MRILCLNAWGGMLHALLVDFIASQDPDVLCLQEVVHTPDAPRDWLTYRDGAHVLDQRADLFADVCRALPGHRATFCPAARGMLWDGDTAVPSYWGLATFVRGDLPVIGQWQGFIHGAYSHDGFGAHPRSRNAHGVRLMVKGVGPVAVAHLHGLRDPKAGKADTPARERQAEQIIAILPSFADPADTQVLCGDFNLTPDSATFSRLATAGLHDLVTGRGIRSTRTSHYKKPGKYADYMLVNRAARVQDFDVIVTPEVSDHCPLLLTLKDNHS